MPHILIVDDEAWLANKLAVHLEKEGHRVATFTGHKMGAFHLIEKLHPDLVVLDHLRANDYDGMQLVYILRNTPALAHLPIVLIIPRYPSLHMLPFMKSFGFQPDAYLEKPFSWDECSEMINRLLSCPKIISSTGESMQ
ncbi:MAG: response regulator [Armatimonadota bacterium]|nr:response regulator [Armatimonadota bacterium]